jgi:hypothetical protein
MSAVSAFCFTFTNPGKRELKEKQRKEKVVDQPGLSDPAPSCFQKANRKVGWQ